MSTLTTLQASKIGQAFRKTQRGVTMIEYALIAALISVVAIVTIRLIGPKIQALFDTILAAFS